MNTVIIWPEVYLFNIHQAADLAVAVGVRTDMEILSGEMYAKLTP